MVDQCLYSVMPWMIATGVLALCWIATNTIRAHQLNELSSLFERQRSAIDKDRRELHRLRGDVHAIQIERDMAIADRDAAIKRDGNAPCAVCAGSGDVEDCICGGSGLERDELANLRLECISLRSRIDAADASARSYERRHQRFVDALGGHWHGSADDEIVRRLETINCHT